MKTGNLLQMYINNSSATSKQDRNLDIEKELSNRTFIKPLPGKGSLVHGGILRAPYNLVEDTFYNMKSFHKSLTGGANDHELGKMNDLGMKIGGLAIAGYLMTKKQTPFAKIMELIGFGSFFASMQLWPKIALQLPAKLIHGVNIRQEYKDSNGRKKMFYQDPQYIPWDLMSDEQINKIGNKMNVPENIPNRREFIQEKMRKVAVQNNTLWMMTAGVATPIMSAMMCKLCEKPVKNWIASKRAKEADMLLGGVNTQYSQYRDTQMLQNLEQIYKQHKGEPVTEEILKSITDIFTKDVHGATVKDISNDLKDLLMPYDRTYIFEENTAKKLWHHVNGIMKEKFPEFNMPDFESYKSMLEREELFNNEINELGVKEIRQSFLFKTKEALMKTPDIDKKKASKVLNELVSSKKIEEIICSHPMALLNDEKIKILKSLSETITDFKAKSHILNEYAVLKFGNQPDTVIANEFNNITDSLLKTFKITNREVKEKMHLRDYVRDLLREKLENITSNEAEYKRVMSELNRSISTLETRLGDLGGADGSYNSTVHSIFDSLANDIRQFMPRTAGKMAGIDGNLWGSTKNLRLSFAENRMLGVKSTLYRLLNTLDFYKRISDKTNILALHPYMPVEVKEEITEFAKNLMIEGTTSDYMTKFYMKRNPNSSSELGEITVEKGKVINKFFQKLVKEGKTDSPDDKMFFREIMKLLYENQLHPETETILSSTLLNNLKEYRNRYIFEMGDYYYFARPHHNVHNTINPATSESKFLQTGMAPDQLFRKAMQENFNGKKWVKIVGGVGVGLLATTVVAQFFFGKMKTPKNGQEQK